MLELLHDLSDWVVGFADSDWAVLVLALASFSESIFFPVPPDPLLIALCLGAATRSLRFAAIATAGSVMGGIIGYGIGAGAWHLAEPWFFDYVPGVSQAAFDRVQALYERWDLWAIFFAGLTPIPYKVFTLSAGVFAINLPIFLVASVLSRGLRFFVLAALIFKFGKPIESFIDRYFNLLATIFAVLIVVGFLLFEFVL